MVVVDDDLIVRTLCEESLLGLPIRLRSFARAEDALSFCSRERVDLAFVDHYLDGMPGLDLLDRLQRLPWRPRTVLVSGHVDKHLALRAVNRAHVSRILEKPIDRIALRLAVCEELGLPAALAD